MSQLKSRGEGRISGTRAGTGKRLNFRCEPSLPARMPGGSQANTGALQNESEEEEEKKRDLSKEVVTRPDRTGDGTAIMAIKPKERGPPCYLSIKHANSRNGEARLTACAARRHRRQVEKKQCSPCSPREQKTGRWSKNLTPTAVSPSLGARKG